MVAWEMRSLKQLKDWGSPELFTGGSAVKSDEKRYGVAVFFEGETRDMQDVNQAARITANVDAIESYLKREFENFSITHVENKPLTHSFTVTDGKKRFMLLVPWSILAEQNFPQRAAEYLSQEQLAAEMRLHGEGGYHWPA